MNIEIVRFNPKKSPIVRTVEPVGGITGAKWSPYDRERDEGRRSFGENKKKDVTPDEKRKSSAFPRPIVDVLA